MTHKFWIITKPTKHSTLEDICFKTDAQGLILQGRGGLDPEDILLTTLDGIEAQDLAHEAIRKAEDQQDDRPNRL